MPVEEKWADFHRFPWSWGLVEVPGYRTASLAFSLRVRGVLSGQPDSAEHLEPPPSLQICSVPSSSPHSLRSALSSALIPYLSTLCSQFAGMGPILALPLASFSPEPSDYLTELGCLLLVELLLQQLLPSWSGRNPSATKHLPLHQCPFSSRLSGY